MTSCTCSKMSEQWMGGGPFLNYICMLVKKSSNKITQKTQFSSTIMDSVLRQVETKGHRGFHSSTALFLFHAECISKGVVYNEGVFLIVCF